MPRVATFDVLGASGTYELATGPGAGVRRAGSSFRLPGVRSRAARRSRCSGVSGGNESITARTCSASTAACSRVAAPVMLGGSPFAVWAGFLLRESVVSISGSAVAVGRACSALFSVVGLLVVVLSVLACLSDMFPSWWVGRDPNSPIWRGNRLGSRPSSLSHFP
jgi:hypothetical protein